jgi:DNA-binding CsgD family transcriptional regulator
MTSTIGEPLPTRPCTAAPHRKGFPGAIALRGRERERRAVADLLARVRRGAGGVLLVEGEPGAGKSALLCDAVDQASDVGFSLAVGAAGRLTGDRDSRDTAAWWAVQIRADLERRAANAPVLVCLDDVQRACPATLAVLRALPRELRQQPVAWVLARSGTSRRDDGYLFELLEQDGAVRVSLPPLGEDTVEALLTDAFGAPPDAGLSALAAQAAGNPSLLIELVTGLREDEAVRVADGQAVLASGRLPRRMPRAAHGRLDALGGQARNLTMTAALLGTSFRLEDAAEMLGETPAALLPAVDEVMGAGIITTADGAFSFRHLLLRRSLEIAIPRPERAALHRRYGRLLLRRGESAALAADHLLRAAHLDGQASLADLDAAVPELLRSAPRVAADLAVRALELTPPASEEALTRAVTATEVLAAAGRLAEAGRIGADTLSGPRSRLAEAPLAEARLRCALSSVLCSLGRPGEAAVEARTVLAQPGLPPAVRDEALTARLQAVAGLRGEPVGSVTAPVLASPGEFGVRVVVAALTADAVESWHQGRIADGLDGLRDAVRQETAIPADARHAQPLLALASALIDLRQVGPAEDILRAAGNQAPAGSLGRSVLSVLWARLHLANGWLADAATDGVDGLAVAESLGAHAYSAAAHCVLGMIALRRGDLAAAALHVAGDSLEGPYLAEFYARAEIMMARAQVADVRDGPAVAMRHIRRWRTELDAHPGLLLGDPAMAPWVTRTALAAGDAGVAVTVARAAAALAADNPGYAAIDAAAAHSLGLAAQDADRLTEAAERHPDPWARASAAEDLAVSHIRGGDSQPAIRRFTEAIEVYQAVGAAADVTRVRRRLRRLGVRRRRLAPAAGRPTTGWESMTETEHVVAKLVARGLNNREIAGRLHVSSHTVAFYLGQIFRKLDIGSRVELTRLVVLRGESAAGSADERP